MNAETIVKELRERTTHLAPAALHRSTYITDIEVATLIEAFEAMGEALKKLSAEVDGLPSMEVRTGIGNTNWNVLMLRLDEARDALAKAGL